MFGPLGVPELLFILVLALLIFGPKKLPEIGRTVGKAMGEFRRASSELRRTINTEIALDEDEAKKSPAPALRRPAVDSESVPRAEPAAGATPSAEAPAEPAAASAEAAPGGVARAEAGDETVRADAPGEAEASAPKP